MTYIFSIITDCSTTLESPLQLYRIEVTLLQPRIVHVHPEADDVVILYLTRPILKT